MNDRVFKEIDEYFCHGFYDWLRDSKGEVIGVRCTDWDWNKENYSPYLSQLPLYDYVETEELNYSLLFYFLEQRDFDPQQSADQDFDENKIYFSEDGVYAITFDIGWLETENVERLKSYPIRWGSYGDDSFSRSGS